MIVTIEDSQIEGGMASLIDSAIINVSHKKVLHFGWSCERFVPHGKPDLLRKKMNLTPQDIAEKIFMEYSS